MKNKKGKKKSTQAQKNKQRKAQAKGVEKVSHKKQTTPQRKPNQNNLLSTGSTMLNLALTDKTIGGFLKGKYYFMVGDSTSGKTFLSMTCFAEASINPNFDDYRFIYDNVEDGCLMDIPRLFGKGVAQRIEGPTGTKKNPGYSYTIEEFYYNLDDALDIGVPFIYVLDSMDSLSSEAEGKKFQEQKEAFQQGKKTEGSYGDGKAKKNSESLRKILGRIGKNGSILIILCQTRDDLGFGFSKKTRSGGRALKFYATCEIWSSVIQTLKKTVKGKARKIGVRAQLETKKNRITGKLKTVGVDIFPSYGMDDIGSCVDYLIEEKYWKKTAKGIRCPEVRIQGTREKIIAGIEAKGLQDKLKEACQTCWMEIEDACSLKRKNKYVDIS